MSTASPSTTAPTTTSPCARRTVHRRRTGRPLEVHYDPYDLSHVYVRTPAGWITAAWTHMPMVSAPFADFTWRHAPFAYGTAEQHALWHALVASLETTLPLRAHQPGTLAALDEYLHRRTAGMIGSLSHLVRGAAIDAILDGTEHLTRAHLDRVRLDHAAEAYAATHPHPAPTSRAAAAGTA